MKIEIRREKEGHTFIRQGPQRQVDMCVEDTVEPLGGADKFPHPLSPVVPRLRRRRARRIERKAEPVSCLNERQGGVGRVWGVKG